MGVSCSASDIRLGVNVHYHFAPGQAFGGAAWPGPGATPAPASAASVSCTAVENSSRTRSISPCSEKNRSTDCRSAEASPKTGSTRGWALVRKGMTVVAPGDAGGGDAFGESASQTTGKTCNILAPNYGCRATLRQNLLGRSSLPPHGPHLVRVGLKTWPATVTGTFRHLDSLATGLATDRVPEDDIIVPLLHFTKDNGELSSVALDEHTKVEIVG